MGSIPKARSRSTRTSCALPFHYPLCSLLTQTFYSTTSRITSEEKRYTERMLQEDPSTNYQNIRRAAEVHRQVRQYARRTIKPGMRMLDIADLIEDGVRAVVEENGLEAGIGFPTGLSRNHCAAHYAPNAGDKIVMYFFESGLTLD